MEPEVFTDEKFTEVVESELQTVWFGGKIIEFGVFRHGFLILHRTMWGVSLEKVELEFGPAIKEQLLKNAQKALASKLIVVEDRHLKITTNGKFLSDGIASELFLV